MSDIAWVAADWGTTNLRLFAMDDRGCPIAEHILPSDFGQLDNQGYEAKLQDALGPWQDRLPDKTTVVACGMVGARAGWSEAPYLCVPLRDFRGKLHRVPTRSDRIDMRIVPGVCQMDPYDVMRGEETQIAGFLVKSPDFTGRICLPGTHTKWATFVDGQMEHFRTFMTGELFGLLAKHSVLQHSIDLSKWDDQAFIDAVLQTKQCPEQVSAALFGIRAESLLNTKPACAAARLSGLLVGLELAANGGDKSSVIVIGDQALSGRYCMAMQALDFGAQQHDGNSLVIDGLISAFRTI